LRLETYFAWRSCFYERSESGHLNAGICWPVWCVWESKHDADFEGDCLLTVASMSLRYSWRSSSNWVSILEWDLTGVFEEDNWVIWFLAKLIMILIFGCFGCVVSAAGGDKTAIRWKVFNEFEWLKCSFRILLTFKQLFTIWISGFAERPWIFLKYYLSIQK